MFKKLFCQNLGRQGFLSNWNLQIVKKEGLEICLKANLIIGSNKFIWIMLIKCRDMYVLFINLSTSGEGFLPIRTYKLMGGLKNKEFYMDQDY